MKRKIKSMSKRTLAILLTFVLLLTAVPVVGLTAFASGEEEFEYEVNEETKECIVMSYLGTEKDVVIPEKINGNTVAAVKFDGFTYRLLSSVTIPKTVKYIECGFYTTVQTEKFVVDPDNENFKSVNDIVFSKDGKTLVIYPSLKRDTEYSIPEGVTAIANRAFTNCIYIKTLNIPASVENLPNPDGFLALENITVAPGNANFCAVDNVVFSKDKKDLKMYPACMQKGLYEIPEGTVNVWINLCYNTRTLVIPTSVKLLVVGNSPNPCYIYNFVYKGSESEWAQIDQPPMATHEAKCDWDGKGYWTYYSVNEDGTVNLSDYVGLEEEVTVPVMYDGHKVVGFSGAFQSNNVKKVTVPGAFDDLSGEDFAGNVEEIVVSENNINYTTVDGVLFNKEMTELVAYPSHKAGKTYTVPNTVKKIKPGAFYCNRNLETVILPKGLEEIEYYAFSDSQNLKEIKIPGSVKNIGNNAFSQCVNLETITIPANTVLSSNVFSGSGLKKVIFEDGCKTICEGSLAYCLFLEEVVIPASVTNIEIDAFAVDEGFDSLSDVYYGGTRSQWKDIVICEGNDALLNANIHYNSEEASTTEPTTETTTAPVETTTEPTTEATTAPTETTTETTTEVTTTKPADTTKPTEAPTKPTEEPTKPTEAPTKPTEAPTKPTEAPTKPTEAPTKPTEAPTKPTEAPTKPTEASTKPTEAPTKPTEAPTKPTEAPTNPTEAPTAPVITTKPTDTTAPADETTAPVNITKQDETTAAVIPGTTVSDTADEESTTKKESIVDTGDSTMVLAALLPMAAAAVAVVVVTKKKKHEDK